MLHPDINGLSKTLGRIFMRLMGLSWRVRYFKPQSGRTGRTRNRPAFFALWHARQLPLIHTHRNEGIRVLVSRSRDGQYIENVLHSMDFGTIRGSSSSGGMKAIREMALVLKDGIDCVITPDGPRGPAEKVKDGMLHISRLGKRPVVPVGASAWPAVRFSSWDGFLLPLPFAHVSVVEGRPVPPMKRGDAPEQWKERVETELNRATACAELDASPSARLFSAILNLTGAVLRPAAFITLMFRPLKERKERKGYVKSPRSRPVWLHGSSLGELNGLIPYAEYLKSRKIPVWITCFTPSGRAFINRMGLEGSYIPLDVPRFAERFMQRIRPRGLILAETEIWPNTILKAIEFGIPCMMINARLSGKSVKGYRFLGSLPAKMLSCFTGILARSALDMKRFLEMGIDKRILSVSGDSKILAENGDPPEEWRIALGTDKPVLVAGSTRNGEELILLQAAESAGYFPVIVPRHLDRIDDVQELMVRMGFKPVRWSELTASSSAALDFDSVLVDVHGVLAQMYGIGDAAFVGGTLVPVGGHNVLEPVMRGVPFIVGPHYESFAEFVDELVKDKIAYIASSHGEIANILTNLSKGSIEYSDVRMKFENIKRKVLDNFAAMVRKSGLTELDKVDEKT